VPRQTHRPLPLLQPPLVAARPTAVVYVASYYFQTCLQYPVAMIGGHGSAAAGRRVTTVVAAAAVSPPC